MSDCILLTKRLDAEGYARVTFRGNKDFKAHRAAWIEQFGPIPEGLVIDHLCRVRNCVNVEHMELVTNAENLRRGYGKPAQNSRRSKCVHGHSFNKANTRWQNGHRVCRTCAMARSRAYELKRSERRRAAAKPPLLTAHDVRFIRAWHAKGESTVNIARAFGTCESNVRQIWQRKTWKEVS